MCDVSHAVTRAHARRDFFLRGTSFSVHVHVEPRSIDLPSGDAAGAFETANGFLVAVCDGSGPAELAARAANAALSAVAQMAIGVRVAEDLRAVMYAAHERVAAEVPGGASTCTIALYHPEGIFEVSAGHSEAWSFPAGKPECLSRRHERWMLGEGRGFYEIRGPFEADATTVVGSDGLYRHLIEDQVIETVSANRDEPAKALARRVCEMVGHLRDDLSAVVVRPLELH